MSTETPAPPVPPPAKLGGFLRWQRRVLGFCLVIFAFEIGMFLIIFPWLHNWDLSWVARHSQRFSDIWMSRYFRGALSGLGLLNVYVALAELVKQLKAMFGEAK
jgi:hypothetical protein